MTFNSLYSEVLELGFEGTAYPVASVLSAANRALSTIYTERRLRRTAYLHTAGLPRRLTLSDLHHAGTRSEEIPLPAGGLSLSAFGRGSVTVKDGNGRREHRISGAQSFIRERVGEGGRLVIIGEPTLELTDIRSYPDYAGDPERLPAGGRWRFDLRELLDGFGGLSAVPRDERERPIAAEIYGRVLLVPEEYRGRITVEYMPLPTPISDTHADAEIDLPAELCPLLPLLTAAYVWLDAEEEKAEFYLSRYRELSGAIPNLSGVRQERYITNGWA